MKQKQFFQTLPSPSGLRIIPPMSFTIRNLSGPSEGRRFLRLPWKKAALFTLAFARPLFHWYNAWQQQREKTQRISFLKKTFIILLAILCALLLILGIANALFSIELIGLQSVLSVSGESPPVDEHGHTNILLLGQGDVTGENLIDSIMIASIDPETKSTVLLSLPRDLYILHPENFEPGKLNSRYRDYLMHLRFQKDMEEKDASLTAIQELSSEIGRTFDLTIHHVIKVDFEGFAEAIDAVDGIEIDVPYDIIDPEYPGPNYTYEPFEIHKGLQHLDGKTALKYVRSRSTTSDFARSARQQQVLHALAAKAEVLELLKNPSRIVRLLETLSEHVEMTLSMREVVGLAAIGFSLDPQKIITMQLHDRNGLYDEVIEPGGFLYDPPRELFDGASVLLPISIPEFPVTWLQPRILKMLLIDQRHPYLTKKPMYILNAGAPMGHARKLANELIRYGFDVPKVVNASIPKQSSSAILHKNEESQPFAQFLRDILDIEGSALPVSLAPDEEGPVTITLGKDYHFVPLQSLISPQ